MNWVIIASLLPYIMQILQIILTAVQTIMVVETADGSVVRLPCKVSGGMFRRLRITATFMSRGSPITGGVIMVDDKVFARAEMSNGPKLYTSGPVTLEATF